MCPCTVYLLLTVMHTVMYTRTLSHNHTMMNAKWIDLINTVIVITVAFLTTQSNCNHNWLLALCDHFKPTLCVEKFQQTLASKAEKEATLVTTAVVAFKCIQVCGELQNSTMTSYDAVMHLEFPKYNYRFPQRIANPIWWGWKVWEDEGYM